MLRERRLLQRRKHGKFTIECPDSYEDVSMLQLLDGLKLEATPQWAQLEEDQMNEPETEDDEI